ncbi:MAG TPA: SusC/RagA family TonB-linked outer membrane protein [Gemmatimonadaceae bacterium]|nr:SusC/RagA family TonB-linked outer membrane protein [Gemmatimonadaceae bacterium]
MRKPTLWAIAAAVFILLPSVADAQRRITGRVTAEGGEPLLGTSVQIVGTPLGSHTNERGEYALNAPAGALSLRFRRLGYKGTVVAVAPDRNEVSVTLDRDVLQLEEQVITGEATSVARQNLANDVATVSVEDLTRAPAPTVDNALQGRIAGATISTNSGAPGGGIQVQLRGITTIKASIDPLYVVDGVVISNDAIPSGANAITAAAGGGNASNQDNAVNRVADINPNDIERIEVLKGASASALYGAKAANGVIIITTKRGSSGRTQFNILQRVGVFDLSNKMGSRDWTLADAIDAYGGTPSRDAEITRQFNNGKMDIEEELYGANNPSYESIVSARGGSGQTTFFVSGLLKRDAGILEGTGYTKRSLRANLTQGIGNRLTLDVTTNLVHALTQRALSNNDNSGTSFYMVLPFTPSFADLKPENGVYPDNQFERSNPFETRDKLTNDENVYRFIGSANMRWSVIANERQSLTISGIGGADQFSQKNDIVSPRELQFEPQDGLPGTIVRGNATNVNSNFALTAVHQFFPSSRAFSTTTSAGVQQSRVYQSIGVVTVRDVLSGQGNIDRGSSADVFEDQKLTKDFAFFGQEEVLALDERLLLTVGGRAERNSNNGDDEKFFFFPKASASFRLLDLGDMLSEVKLRAAWGQSGNQPVYGMKFTSYLSGAYDARNALQTNLVAGDADIQPERQTELEGGFDATLWGGRSSLTVTVYQKTIDDLILERTAAPSSGFQTQLFNGGQLRNRGVEVELALTPLQSANLTWISRATFSRNRSEITELPVPTFQTGGFGTSLGAMQIEQGKSATQIVGNDTVGGQLVTRQLGDVMPDFQMGFSNEVTMGAFRLFGLLDWRKGGDIINLTELLYDAGSNSEDYEEGARRITDWAVRGLTRPFIQDGSFVKLREVTLSYALPENLVGTLFRGQAQGARIELSGRNLYTWTDYRGLDPEVSNFGNQAIARNIDVAPYPPSRSFFFSLGVDF